MSIRQLGSSSANNLTFRQALRDSAEVLIREFRNPDNGFALDSGGHSSIVNTSEAIFVLSLDFPTYDPVIPLAAEYVRKKLKDHSLDEKSGYRLRYYVFGLIGLVRANVSIEDESVKLCILRICDIFDGNERAWGHARGMKPNVSATCMAMWALQQLPALSGQISSIFDSALDWLFMAQNSDHGWGLDANDEASDLLHSAMSLAILGSSEKYKRNNKVHSARKYLREQLSREKGYPLVDEQLPGASWRHFTYAWVALAFQDSSQSPEIADVVQYIQNLKGRDSGYWQEQPGTRSASNSRAMFWVFFALQSIRCSFDPCRDLRKLSGAESDRSLVLEKWPLAIAVLLTLVLHSVLLYSVHPIHWVLLLESPSLLFFGYLCYRYRSLYPKALKIISVVAIGVTFLLNIGSALYKVHEIWLLIKGSLSSKP